MNGVVLKLTELYSLESGRKVLEEVLDSEALEYIRFFHMASQRKELKQKLIEEGKEPEAKRIKQDIESCLDVMIPRLDTMFTPNIISRIEDKITIDEPKSKIEQTLEETEQEFLEKFEPTIEEIRETKIYSQVERLDLGFEGVVEGICIYCAKTEITCECKCIQCNSVRKDCACDDFVITHDMVTTMAKIRGGSEESLAAWSSVVYSAVCAEFTEILPKIMKDKKKYYCVVCFRDSVKRGKYCRICRKKKKN